jgi:uroporphyrinogen-III synthase
VWAVAEREVDAVVFTSAPGAEAWLRAVEDEGLLAAVVERCAAGHVLAGAVGPVTAAPLERRGITPVQPDRARLGALVRSVVAHYEQSAALVTVAGPLVVRARVAVLDGRVLPLSATGVEILRLLTAAPGAVITREQVLDALPGGSRDPHAVEVAVARTREAIGRKDLIRTVVKRGYTLALAGG